MAETTPPATRMVRVADDLATMASEIVEVEGGSVAALLDPMIRKLITERHHSVKQALDQIRAAKERVRASRAALATNNGE